MVKWLIDFTVDLTTFLDQSHFCNELLKYTALLIDGSPLPSWLTFTASTLNFYGRPTAAGIYTIRLTATNMLYIIH